MKKRKYTLEEVEALNFRDIYKPRFETDGMCYIFADVDSQGYSLTALDIVDDEIKVPWKDDDIRIALVRICDILNGKNDLHYEVDECLTCGDGCIKFKNGLFLRVRGWGHLTSTYVDYENPDHSVPVNQEMCLGHLQDRFAVWVACTLDPEFRKKRELAIQKKIIRNSVYGNSRALAEGWAEPGLFLNEETRKYFKEFAVSRGYLGDWYQQSIDETQPPIWTDEHLDELYNDFYLIPKR